MNKILKSVLLGGLFIFFVASPIAVIATPQNTSAADGVCEKSLLGIPPWYRGLVVEENSNCNILSPNDANVGGISNFIWKIVLNVIQIGLVLAGYLALFFIMYGAFMFITGGGNSSQIEKARKSIFNAVIGLVISMGAVAITNLIFGVLDGATYTNNYGVPELEGEALLKSIVNLVYFIAGIVAVIVVIIGGLTYATSIGDSGRITRAKNMILYAVIGLVLLLAAFAITNFVIDRFE